MATNIQRWQAIGDALLNRSATAAQLSKLGLAIASKGPAMDEYMGLTSNAKAGYALAHLRRHMLSMAKEYYRAAAVTQAVDNTSASIDAEFAEAP